MREKEALPASGLEKVAVDTSKELSGKKQVQETGHKRLLEVQRSEASTCDRVN